MSITFEKTVYREPETVSVTIDKLEDWVGFTFESSSGLTEEFAAFARRSTTLFLSPSPTKQWSINE